MATDRSRSFLMRANRRIVSAAWLAGLCSAAFVPEPIRWQPDLDVLLPGAELSVVGRGVSAVGKFLKRLPVGDDDAAALSGDHPFTL